MKLSRSEAFMLLYLVESYLPQAEPDELPTLEALLEALQALSPAAPFRTATEARSHAH
jgi:hypothetical protein